MLARNAAISLALYQRRSTWSLASLMAVVIFRRYVHMAGPCSCLMPDITPPSLRSKANGVINLMVAGSLFLSVFKFIQKHFCSFTLRIVYYI